MNVLDLFSGIGGFSLGLERAGFHTVAFCECDPYARAVLAKHWPGVPCYPDVRELSANRLAADGIAVDVICGGFPCQDISVAGNGAGLAGERSGLWTEYARLVRELGPRYVIVENVSALLTRGLDTVLGGLAAVGYDAEWHCIPAAYIGAPHRRDRVWIVAYPQRHELWHEPGRRRGAHGPDSAELADDGAEKSVADASGSRLSIAEQAALLGARWRAEGRAATQRGWWDFEPDVGRVADGVPGRVDRLKCLGNAVVPQIPEILGHAIMRHADAL